MACYRQYFAPDFSTQRYFTEIILYQFTEIFLILFYWGMVFYDVVHYSLLNCSPMYGQLGCFQYFAIINNTAVNKFAHVGHGSIV